MAVMRCEGLDNLIKKLNDIAELDKAGVTESMLLAGSQDVKKAWEHEIVKRDLIKSGLMSKNITSSKPKMNIYGMFTTIYPQGWEYDNPDIPAETASEQEEPNGKKRVRNAEKAFMLHYGFYNHVTGEVYTKAVGWVDDVEAEAFRTATATMEKIFNNYIKSKG